MKIQTTNSKFLTRKITKKTHSPREAKCRIIKHEIYLTRQGSWLWFKALVRDMKDEILRRRRQGKTETLYT